MKKIIAILLACTMLFALCACGSKTTSPATTAATAPAATAAPAAAETAAEEAAPEVEIVVDAATIAGDWYGWWIVDDATGYFAEEETSLIGYWNDCCASVAEVNGVYTIYVWDTQTSRELPLGELTISGGEVTDGYFYEEGFTVTDSAVSIEDGYLKVSATASSSADEDAITFTLNFHPWGDKWEGVALDELPMGFESWYLPLLEAGAEVAPTEVLVEATE